jgi:hypothetical protein
MRKAQIAEFVLSLFTSPERAASTVGDLIENAAARGVWGFWWDISRTAFSLLWNSLRAEPLFMASIGFRGLLLSFSLLLLTLICIIVFIPLSLIVVSLPFSAAGIHLDQWALRFSWVSGLLGGLLGLIAVLAVQFQTGRWIARRARGREMAACVAFLVTWEIVMRISGEILSRGHLLDFLTSYSHGVTAPTPDMPAAFMWILVISSYVDVIALFAGAIWVRRRFINEANALS